MVELAAELGASRGGVVQALDALRDLGLVARNQGHGHPLRPEVVLTGRGEDAAAAAREFLARVRELRVEGQALRKWPMPVLYGVGEEEARFSRLRRRLPPITDRALSESLQSLEVATLADRLVRDERPPHVSYRPTARASRLRPALRHLIERASSDDSLGGNPAGARC